MKIIVEESKDYNDLEVVIRCKKCDDKVLSIMSKIKSEDEIKILGKLDEKTYILYKEDVFYFESVDKKCFAYTKTQVFEVFKKLFELEEMLFEKGFFRATKSTIINISKIKSIKTLFNSTMVLEMENGENLPISRQYTPMFKEKIGGKTK